MVVVPITTCPASHYGPAIATTVSTQKDIRGIGPSLQMTGLLYQSVPFMTMWTATLPIGAPHGHSKRESDAEQNNHPDHPSRHILTAIVVVPPQVEFAPVQDRSNRLHTDNHTRTIISFSKIREHITVDNTAAQGIRKYTFQSVTRHKTHLVASDYQQDSQSIVGILTADTPLRKKRMGKCKEIIALDLLDCHYGNLRQCLVTQGIANRIDLCYGSRRKHPVWIGGKTIAIGKLHVRNLLDPIRPPRP